MAGFKQDAPVLKESRTEYFLYVPYGLRHRARRIEGRRWDPARKCWVLPKTSRVFEDLRLEFGEGLVAPTRRANPRRWHSVRRWIGLIILAALLSIWAFIYWNERAAKG